MKCPFNTNTGHLHATAGPGAKRLFAWWWGRNEKDQHCRTAVLRYHRHLRYRLRCANVFVGTEEKLRPG